MSNYVFVLDTQRTPLTPCKPSMARRLLSAGKAKVFRRYPFTIILNKEVRATPELITLKIDPGSRITGIALVQGSQVLFGAELTHRGQAIKASLESRRTIRRSRRTRHTRYRQSRFSNRTRTKGWLAPSLQHRVETTLTIVNRLRVLASIGLIVQELVRFDLQQLENPEISGIEYQQGALQGYEVREYLLNKWGRKCALRNMAALPDSPVDPCTQPITYLGGRQGRPGADNLPLQIEHIHKAGGAGTTSGTQACRPKSRGGTDRISNLCLACEKCNIKKGVQPIEKFLANKPEALNRILAQAKCPLRDAAAVNSTRWALFNRLKEIGFPVSTGSGGLTKFNRTRLGLPKAHWLDAACVGQVDNLKVLTSKPLLIKATGHGSRQMCRTDKFGFPSRYVPRNKFVKGFQTGDIVKAVVTSGKKIGVYVGRVAVRSSGSFNISTAVGLIQGISYRHCRSIHLKDGYDYAY